MKKAFIAFGIAAVLPNLSFAQAPSYDYVEATLAGFDVDSLDLFGFKLEGSYEFSPQIFGRVSYSSLSDEVGNIDVDYSDWAFGVGYVFHEQGNTNAYAGMELLSAELDAGPANADGDGFALFVGLRSQINSNLELNGELNLADIEDDNQTSVKGGLIYSLENNWAFSANISSTEGDMGWGLGVRYEF